MIEMMINGFFSQNRTVSNHEYDSNLRPVCLKYAYFATVRTQYARAYVGSGRKFKMKSLSRGWVHQANVDRVFVFLSAGEGPFPAGFESPR